VVHPPAVELVLLLVEAVYQVLGAAAGLPARVTLTHAVCRGRGGRRAGLVGRLHVVVEVERLVPDGAVVRGGRCRAGAAARRRQQSGVLAAVQERDRVAGRDEVGVVLKQASVGVSVLVDLRGVSGIAGCPDAVDGLATDLAPAAVEVVEAMVLLVDDHQVFVVADWVDLSGLAGGCGRDEHRDGGQRSCTHETSHPVPHGRGGIRTVEPSMGEVRPRGDDRRRNLE